MTPGRLKKVQALFAEAIKLPLSERHAFLQASCGSDLSLVAEVESLLSQSEDDGSALGQFQLQAERSAKRNFTEHFDYLVTSGPKESTPTMEVRETAGMMIGCYHLLQKIGEGGMGEVWLAEQKEPVRRRVALKLVKAGMSTPEVIGRFESERQALALMDHPVIAKVFDAGSTLNGVPYFAMEYVAGVPITAYCDNHRLTTRERLELFLHVCEGVQHAHQKAIIHRDLKPSNILVTEVDGRPAPKIIDFGVAKALSQKLTADTTFTRVGALVGTPEYMSPEQAKSSGEDIDTRTDVYSLGIIFYELLAGVPPLDLHDLALEEFLRRLREEEPPTPSTKIRTQDPTTSTDLARKRRTEPLALAKQVHGDLDSIALKALEKERSRRYGSPSELAADIERYLRGEVVLAVPSSATYHARKFARRYRVALATTSAFAVVLVAATAVSIRQTVRANRRFEQLRQLAGKFLLDFHEAIAKLPGSTPARKMVVETGLQYYDSLAREAAGNRDLLEEIARGYDRLGDVQGNPYTPNLGDLGGAFASYKKALSIRDRISDPSPGFLRDRILGKVRIAQILMIQGDVKKAESTLLDTISTGAPSADYVVRQALLKAYGTLGDLQIRLSLHTDAIAPFEKLLDLSEQLAREHRNPVEEERAVSLAHTKLGDTLARMGRNREAMDHLRIALEIDKRMAAVDANDLSASRKLFITYLILGQVYRNRTGQQFAGPGEANATLEAAAALADKMAAADPNNKTALMDVLTAWSGLGDLLREQNRLDKAVACYRKSVDAVERLNSDGAHSFANLDAGIQAHHRLGIGLARMGQAADALEQFQKASGYLSASEKLNPGLTRNILRKAEIDAGRAEAFKGQGSWKEAIGGYLSALAVYESEHKRDPKDETLLNELPELYADLADCYAAAGDLSSAVQAARTALARYGEIEAARPLVEEEQKEKGSTLERLAQWSK